MASLKDIRKRIGTVRSTQQITKAMKMVAAAKLRRAQAAALAARPYAHKLETIVTHLVSRLPGDVHPLLRVPENVQRALVILVTSDRGLRGGYNANLGRALEAMSIENGTRFVRSNLMRAPLGWTANASPAAKYLVAHGVERILEDLERYESILVS